MGQRGRIAGALAIGGSVVGNGMISWFLGKIADTLWAGKPQTLGWDNFPWANAIGAAFILTAFIMAIWPSLVRLTRDRAPNSIYDDSEIRRSVVDLIVQTRQLSQCVKNVSNAPNWATIFAASTMRLQEIEKIEMELPQVLEAYRIQAKTYDPTQHWPGKTMSDSRGFVNFNSVILRAQKLATEVLDGDATIGHPNFDLNHEKPVPGDAELANAEKRMEYRRIYDQAQEAQRIINRVKGQVHARWVEAEKLVLEQGK